MDFILDKLPYLFTLLGTLVSWEGIKYLITLKSQKKKAHAEAEAVSLNNTEKKLNMEKDQWTYLKSICDQAIKDFYESETKFKTELKKHREELEEIDSKWEKKYQAKCLEIATVKEELARIKCLICYKITCKERETQSPCTQKN